MSSIFYRTTWSYETSEDVSVSALATVSVGKLFFKEEDTGRKLVLRYRCVSLGQGKSFPLGLSFSRVEDPSGGLDRVLGVKGQRYFGPSAFPAPGYMFGAGASAGFLGSFYDLDLTGGGFTLVLFGAPSPFAAIKIWGLGRALLPGLGLSGGFAAFLEDS